MLVSTMFGLMGLLPGPASAPCSLPPPGQSGPLSVLLDTGLSLGSVDFGSLRLDHASCTWRWAYDGRTIPPPRTGYAVRFTLDGSPVVWAGPLDVTVDGFIDGADYDAFHNWFELGDPRADFNADGFVDGIDSDAFVNAWR